MKPTEYPCECGGNIVVSNSRGHDYAHCNRCSRILSLEGLIHSHAADARHKLRSKLRRKFSYAKLKK